MSLLTFAALGIVLPMAYLDGIVPPTPATVPHDPIARALWYGIDISLLQANLRRTPTERLERHRQALLAAEAIRKAARERRIRKASPGTIQGQS